MTLPLSRKKLRPRSRKLFSLESLEERTVMAGNVTAIYGGGALTLIGDTQDNQIAVTQRDSTGIRISALDATTKINGQSSVDFGNVTGPATFLMGDGNDVLRLQGSAATPLTLGGASTVVQLGAGNDTAQFSNVNILGTFQMFGGDGADTIVAQRSLTDLGATTGFGLRTGRVALIQTQGGADNVTLRNSSFNSVSVLDLGSGNDKADVRSSEFSQISIFLGGADYDTLNSAANTFRAANFPLQFEARTAINGPVAVNDNVNVNEGGVIPINVLGNDTTTSGALNSSSVVIVTPPVNGNVVKNADGTVTYTHNGGETTNDTFTYTVADVNGNVSNQGTVQISIIPVNDLPTLTAVGNVTTQEDVATEPLFITVGDAETAPGAVVVTATSSNTSVVANNGIAITGTGANRTVVVTPVANASGTATITLTATDGNNGTATQTFVVTVTPSNDLPTITGGTNILAPVGTTIAPATITVGDQETAAGSLLVTGASSNQALIADSGIQISGTGAARTVTITPVANATGTATITLKVDDTTGGTTTQTFTVTISNPPSITDIADQTTLEDTATTAASFTVGDVETVPANLTVTATSSNTGVVAANGIQITGTGATRSVVVTPVANASGSSTITVTVTDEAGLSVTDTFVVTVTSVNDVPVVVNEQASANARSQSTVTLNGNVLSNDTDVDGPQTLLVSNISIGGTNFAVPANGQVSAATGFGNITVRSDGTYTYTYVYVPGSPNAQAIDLLASLNLLPIPDEIFYDVTDGLATTQGTLSVNLG